MRKLLIILAVVLAAMGGWYVAWKNIMADDVAQVKASIAHHAQAIRSVSHTAVFKADDVYATGFPFSFRVAVHRPTLTQVWGNESYAVSFEKIKLRRSDDARFEVDAPVAFNAMYAQVGKAPEQYRVKLNEMPTIWVASEGSGPFTQYGSLLPKKLVLDVTLDGRTEQIGFDFLMPLPMKAPIPADVSRPLQIFVGMLREALVFQR